ncbi:protein translocase subunit SecD [Verminephrobacter aporrectodeae]|uniref:protein translocase subunit SecD n=1 Tax=Verminephrobacter aporrectodeae TaxID=1110389 RepID=UPI0022375056|nr:protein translocase subunit SecD [Verminephrobacter aporrectodeae]MCW5221914.1 protein translocase subunit SecD [Verminephrobacter aporrectodeae subsp. tuberculatae]MCW5291205.1 protein translocase subunit SecD [Verminephrobacter aporrectodeae subsp. tuberculatae]MCW8174598.1 protein translocase subunit SecD [Verminephrobacter aporrectodeae subsp. tuberculatae]MCW8203056.1 protein translocase subunit SecD [Verminephrobacter aporrectodeae subsp. tuberculatae]
MNRYPIWKYAILGIVLLVGALYTLPNFFGEAPAVQVSSAKAAVQVNEALRQRIEQALAAAGVTPQRVDLEGQSVRVRFDSPDTQLKARDAIQKALVPDANDASYIVALNLVARSPAWLKALHANPMYLGLDLRGGVHFMLQVDIQAALTRKAEAYVGDLRTALRDKNIRHGGVSREGYNIDVVLRDEATLAAARALLAEQFPDLQASSAPEGAGFRLRASIEPQAARRVQEQALKQNMVTLHNRINELGVAEPVIQQQGLERIVVQLPGVQDTAKAKDILGRTATLEVRMVDESAEARAAQAGRGPVPFGSERHPERNGQPIIVKKQVIFTGENLTDAQPGFDGQTQEPSVNLTLDAKGARIFRDITRENVGRRMAIVLFEKGRGEVVTAPVIRAEIGGGRVQITGRMTTAEAHDTALLLRAGSLAAPMEIIEEFTVGPTLGADNIERGIDSVLWGLAVIAIFMCLYYLLFGLFSSVALAVNLLLLVAVLSMLQATLTLPGIAAMALAIGVAIDSNVLINERIREELRSGVSAQVAIHTGYERAWATILDSNVTTLIAGLALLTFGSGPVRGFAVVHCIGILTSMFSAVFFSRALVNLWYGRRKRLKSISIGQVWKPQADGAAAKTN